VDTDAEGFKFRKIAPAAFLVETLQADHALLYSAGGRGGSACSSKHKVDEKFFPCIFEWRDDFYYKGRQLAHPSTWKTLKSRNEQPLQEGFDFTAYRPKVETFEDASPSKKPRVKVDPAPPVPFGLDDEASEAEE
jgi:hypothetical protein